MNKQKDDRNTQNEKIDPRQLALSALRRIRETKDKGKRLRIIQSISRIDSPWALDVLLEALADSSEEIRNCIKKRLAGREDLDLTRLYERLTNPPWNVKIEVLKILGLRKEEESSKHIATVLKDSNVDVRKTAAEVLGIIGGKEANALLVQLAKDANPFVRRAAEASLRKTSELKFM